jgi:hypothetical protein
VNLAVACLDYASSNALQFLPLLIPRAHAEMAKIPARTLALLEKAAKVALKVRATKPETSRKLVAVIFTALEMYKRVRRVRAGYYISQAVRFRGIWRNWRDAGLQHLTDATLIQFCGFPLKVLANIEQEMLKDPDLSALDRNSKYWKRQDPRACPACDVLDLLVLALREMCTIGYQHQLCTDMGLTMSSVSRYLPRGKKALKKMLLAHRSSRFGNFEHPAMGVAAMAALEAQHGPCPMKDCVFSFAIDGTVSPLHEPPDDEDKVHYYSVSKKIHGVNSILLVSPFGTVHAYRVCLPGCVPDTTAAEPIFSWLFDSSVNPHLFGVLADWGFARYCHSLPGLPPVARPFQPTKEAPITDPELAALVAEFSRWVCSCRQYSEWVNGSAKRGFPRWQMKADVRFIKQLESDIELYLMLYNYRVRECEWSQTRTVYLSHIQACFDEQGLVYNEVDGSFTPQKPYVGPPEEDE